MKFSNLIKDTLTRMHTLMKRDAILTPYIEMNSEWISDLNVRELKLQNYEKTGHMLHDVALGSGFLM